ncbi:putative lipid II flippase FtsW [Bacillus solimangrovi]|uniref:Probable peptidoglycan glycosyltransferase FtsW n=1 Tax=Bacillus solimangrovi TaxID=1305675 RepID=A0A1E5LIJ8_9BACI|nr:putative lipid II flippase FtsW [Bacillus solimangrovi]OEH93910.1 cell division protein FtsW [Bacillus solimangrovi]
MLKKVLKSYDYSLVVLPILLSIFGVIMVYSSSMVWAVMINEGSTDLYYKRQLIWFWISLVAFFFAAAVPYTIYKRFVKLIFFASPILLIIVLLFGVERNNAKSWLEIGGFGFQPAEFIKVGLIIYLSAVFARKQSYIDRFWPAFGPPLLFTGIVFLLIFIQPDLGTGSIILLIAYVMVCSSGIRLKHWLRLTGAGIIAVLLMIPFLSPEQISRFTSAYDPFSSPLKHGYQVINGYIAIANGGVTGKGLGESVQKFGYLPEPHTDFIMAIISEELGIFGVSFVLLSLFFIIIRGLHIARKNDDPFASLLAIGISSMIGIQSGINLGALLGILPVTGVTLPFVSYGGSSLFILMFSVGILVNISMFTNLKVNNKQQKDFQLST